VVTQKESTYKAFEKVVHKLKPLLQNIIGYAELMKKDVISDQNSKRCKIIANAGRNINELIDFCCNKIVTSGYNHDLRSNIFTLGDELSKLSKKMKRYDKSTRFNTFFDDSELCDIPLIGDNIRFREMIFSIFEWFVDVTKFGDLPINLLIASNSNLGTTKNTVQIEIVFMVGKDATEKRGKYDQKSKRMMHESINYLDPELEYFNSNLFTGRYILSQLNGELVINDAKIWNPECRILVPFERINDSSCYENNWQEKDARSIEKLSKSHGENCNIDIEALLSDLSTIAPGKKKSVIEAIELLNLNEIIKLVSEFTEESDAVAKLCKNVYAKNYKSLLCLQDALEQRNYM